VSNIFAGDISRALEDSSRVMSVTEALPALDMLCLEGKAESSVDKFISVRRDSGRSVVIVNSKTDFYERMKSYE
jgi:hypothetical protein